MVLTVLLAALAGLGGCSEARNFRAEERFRPWGLEQGVRSEGPVSAVSDVRLAAAYEAAVAMVDAGQYTQAEGKFAPLVGQFRQSGDADRASKSWFWMAYCMEKRGTGEAAAGEYRKLAAEYPASQAAKVAKGRLERMGVAGRTGPGGRTEPAGKTGPGD